MTPIWRLLQLFSGLLSNTTCPEWHANRVHILHRRENLLIHFASEIRVQPKSHDANMAAASALVRSPIQRPLALSGTPVASIYYIEQKTCSFISLLKLGHTQRAMTTTWQCHQFLSGLLFNGHLPPCATPVVSVGRDGWFECETLVTNRFSDIYLMVEKTPKNLSYQTIRGLCN